MATNNAVFIGWGYRTIVGPVTFNDPIYLADGTAAAPSLAFANSTTTGLYRVAADALGFSTAGV